MATCTLVKNEQAILIESQYQSQSLYRMLKQHSSNPSDEQINKAYDLLIASILKLFIMVKRQSSLRLDWIDSHQEEDIHHKRLVIEDIVDLFKYHKMITLEELNTIWERGAIGIYGTYMGINKSVVHHWLECYKKERNAILKSHIHSSQTQRVDVSSNDSDKNFKSAYSANRKKLLKVYNNLKENNASNIEDIPDKVEATGLFWNIWYARFNTKGLISMDLDEKRALFSKFSTIYGKRAKSYCERYALRKELMNMINENIDLETLLSKYGL
ncbi:hypothetical protein [Aureibacter tunicatorum]|uniref:Uncharacterized protein n=1 Tax=Aureibacter tunicatorum TaxID=866807 RepID=A0AAE3XQ08_9BACT|nr:hypothetical protein [Aureibacter tunicatorum]MDR6241911.1 hypothetical protein [Aureibacter tunicatorum]BDD07460.1 hypothetical protein AUTU_49430 [Aureibacter tunicatorum]